jgi:putative membrane protein
MKTILGSATLLALATWLALAPVGRAQQPGQGQQANRGGEQSISDPQFVAKASASGLAEVNLSMLAEKQSSSPAVQKFAQRMVRDHSKANKQLNGLADQAQMRVAQRMDAQHQALAEKLSALQGPAFDQAYINAMLKDHEQAVKLFSNEAKNGQNEALRSFASETLPILEEHLQMVRKLAGASGNAEGTSTNPGRDR